MLWIIFPLTTAILFSLCNFTENAVVDNYCKKLRPQCLKVAYLGFDIIILLAFLIWQGSALLSGLEISGILTLMAAGAVGTLGGIPYLLALKKDNTTGVTLLTQMAPIMSLAFGMMFLRQMPSLNQGFAFALIMIGMLLAVVQTGRKFIKIELKTGSLMAMACLSWVLSDVIFVSGAGDINFWTGFFWLSVGAFVTNAFMALIFKSWREDLKKFWKRNKKKKFAGLTAIYGTWFVAEIMWRMGMLAVPIAIMSVTANVMQLIATFILGIILTMLWPKFGREKLEKKTIFRHALATIIVIAGIILIG